LCVWFTKPPLCLASTDDVLPVMDYGRCSQKSNVKRFAILIIINDVKEDPAFALFIHFV